MVFGRLKSLFGSPTPQIENVVPSIETIVKPETAFYAIGDIHGCLDLLNKLLDKINAESAPDTPIIFLGDYVDRGVQSAQVLAKLFELNTSDPEKYICLMGNHEKMMLEFIDDPLGRGARWLVNGGSDTLKSYGVTGIKIRANAEDALDAADALEAAMPKGLQAWLRDLSAIWSSGNVHCVHAALDPSKPISKQREEVMLWGHRDFMKVPREDGECVVFGHVIVPDPDVRDGRIGIDTGAYKSGKLTGVCISTDGWRFLDG